VRYLFETSRDELFKVSDESHDLAWVPLAEIESVTTEASILRMVEKTG
jgi:hypothetical protein